MTELSRRVSTATRWSLVNTVIRRIGTFASGVVLARFYFGPQEWGLYAVGLLVLAMLLSLNEMGVSLALVRWDGDIRRFAPTVLTLSTVSSTALYVLLYVTAPTVAGLLVSADATAETRSGATLMLRLLCLSIVIDGIACVPGGLLNREFQQGRRTVVETVNFAVNTGVTIALAELDMGAISFAWGSLAGNLVALVGFSLCAPGMLRYGWDPALAARLLRFGLPLAGASLLTLGIVNVGAAVIGPVLGPAALGLYAMAFNMSSWPVRIVSETARRVSFAGFSRLAHSPEQFAAGFHRALSLVVAAAVPICVLIGVLADPLIRFVYTDTWAGAALPLQWLVVLGLIRVAVDLAYDGLATRRRKTLMAMQAWWLAALLPVLIVAGRYYGVGGVAAGQALVAGLLVVPVFLVVLSTLGIGAGAIARACLLPASGGLVMGVATWGVSALVGPGFVGLAAASTAGMAAYAPFVVLLVRGIRRGVPPQPPQPQPPQQVRPEPDGAHDTLVPTMATPAGPAGGGALVNRTPP